MTKSARPGRTTKLTKRTVDAMRATDTRFIVWDTDLPGFGLRVEPTGRKTFVARYRAGGGRTGALRQATIGRYGPLTTDEARRKAKRLLGLAAGGGDPVGEKRQAQKRGVTVGEVADWYLREAAAGRLLGRRGRPIKASTLAMDRSRIEVHVRPLIGHKPVSALAVADLEAMQSEIAMGRRAKLASFGERQARGRGGIASGGAGVAPRTLGMVSTILEHARRAAIISANPAKGARKMAVERRPRRLSLDEIRALGAVIRDAQSENPSALAAVRFALVSGFRRNEVLALRVGNLIQGGIDLSDSKSGPQVRPIGKAAMDILSGQRAQTEGEPASWLFPAERGAGHFVGLPKVLSRLCKTAKLDGVTIHTLRHTFASIAGELGFSELVIAGLLGHSAGSVTSGYVHLDRALVTAADRVAEAIARALDGDDTATIYPLRAGALD
jgi:integrase